MSKFTTRLFLLSALLMIATGAVLRAEAPAIIAKARAYLGGDAALNAITSLHYHGTLDMGEATGDQTKAPVAIEIIFQKPYRQRSIITSREGTKITVLDGYDGWQRSEAANDTTRWTLVLLKADQIKNLRANVWENLAFFRGIESVGGSLEDLGRATVDGQLCRKLAFIHSPVVTFYRYFDTATGRLVLTETKQGESIREEGTIEVAGVKFPQTLITDTTQADGSKRTVRITFSRVTVNEPVPEKDFEMPPLISP